MLSLAENSLTRATRICFVDVEATGLDVLKDRIIQIAWLIQDLESGKTLRTGMRFIHVPPPLSEEIIGLTNIDDAQLAACGESAFDVLSEFKDDLMKFDVQFLCGHNLNKYDYPIINNELNRVGLDVLTLKGVDSRTDINYPTKITERRLIHLAAAHGFLPFGEHDARYDVDTLHKIFNMYDWKETIANALVPSITIHIATTYDQREIAKKLGYRWEGESKKWLKEIKEDKFLEEVEKANGIKVVRL